MESYISLFLGAYSTISLFYFIFIFFAVCALVTKSAYLIVMIC